MNFCSIFFPIVLLTLTIQEIASSSCTEYVSTLQSDYEDSNEENIADLTLACYNVTSVTNLPLPSLYEHFFQDYQHSLVIKDSNVPTLPSGAFLDFHDMIKIDLSRIHLRKIEVGAFDNLTVLEKLYLDNNELSELVKEMFSPLVKLKVLELGDNQITRVDKFAFSGVENLKKLSLRNNRILMIEDDTFKDQKIMHFLDISGNPLGKVPIDGVPNFKHNPSTGRLIEFVLSDINLSKFDVYLSNTSIELLNLSSNLLEMFDFSYAPKSVFYIDLSNNRISLLKNLQAISYIKINLNGNKINTLESISFNNIKEIYLSCNQIDTIEGNPFDNSSSTLDAIDLSHNKIARFDKTVFSDLVSLEKLNLSHNSLTEITLGSFKKIIFLTVLDLSHNNIESFKSGTFTTLKHLQILDISHNKLKEVNHNIFGTLSVLKHFNFDNNQVTSFDFKYLKNENSLQNLEISLENNPWTCKDLAQIYHTFKESRIKLVEGSNFEVENFHGIACINQKEVDQPNINNTNLSLKTFSSNLKKAIDEGIESSKLNQIFNENFNNSRFFQNFNKDKSLEKRNGKDDKMTSVLVVGTIIQILVSSSILIILLLIFVWYKNIILRKLSLMSSMELPN